jgi:hypothetical protein
MNRIFAPATVEFDRRVTAAFATLASRRRHVSLHLVNSRRVSRRSSACLGAIRLAAIGASRPVR